jgi:hypothetical protein
VRHRHGQNYAAPLPYTKKKMCIRQIKLPSRCSLTAIFRFPMNRMALMRSITNRAVIYRYRTNDTACCFLSAVTFYQHPKEINLYTTILKFINPFIIVTINILMWLHLTQYELKTFFSIPSSGKPVGLRRALPTTTSLLSVHSEW